MDLQNKKSENENLENDDKDKENDDTTLKGIIKGPVQAGGLGTKKNDTKFTAIYKKSILTMELISFVLICILIHILDTDACVVISDARQVRVMCITMLVLVFFPVHRIIFPGAVVRFYEFMRFLFVSFCIVVASKQTSMDCHIQKGDLSNPFKTFQTKVMGQQN
jgi:hypothetical protein